MTADDELAWYRQWRQSLIASVREWQEPRDYKDACSKWGRVRDLLNQKPPQADTPPTEIEGRS